jgi:hypothetical protein
MSSALVAAQGMSMLKEKPEIVFAGTSFLLLAIYLAVEYFKGGAVAKSDIFGRYASALFLIVIITTQFLSSTKGMPSNNNAMMIALVVFLGVFCLLSTLCF